MSNNPFIHHEYLEIVTAEDLQSLDPNDRANKVVVTDSSGLVPTGLIPATQKVSSITVGASTVTGAVTFITPTGSAITISADNVANSVSFTTTAVSAVNNLTAGITLLSSNNLFIYTDVSGNSITLSDDLIRPAQNSTDISSVINEFTTDANGRLSTVTKKEVRGVTTGNIRTTAFTYDTKGRLTQEQITFVSTGRVITKSYTYPPSGSALPEEIPLSFTKTIS
jgi:hypothetical protein